MNSNINDEVIGEVNIELFDGDGNLKFKHKNKNTLSDNGIRYLLEEQLRIKNSSHTIWSPFQAITLGDTDGSTDRKMIIPKGKAVGTAHFINSELKSGTFQGQASRIGGTLIDGKFSLVAEFDSTKEIPSFNSVYLSQGTQKDLTSIGFGNDSKVLSDADVGENNFFIHKDNDVSIIFNRDTKVVEQFKIVKNANLDGYHRETIPGTTWGLDVCTMSGYVEIGQGEWLYFGLLYSKNLDRYVYISSCREGTEGKPYIEGRLKGDEVRIDIINPYNGVIESTISLKKNSFDADTLGVNYRSNWCPWGGTVVLSGDILLFSAKKNNTQVLCRYNIVTKKMESTINMHEPLSGYSRSIISLQDDLYLFSRISNTSNTCNIYKIVGESCTLYSSTCTNVEVNRLGYLPSIGTDVFFYTHYLHGGYYSLGFTPGTINILKDNTGKPISVVKHQGESLKITYSFSFKNIDDSSTPNRFSSRALQSMVYNVLTNCVDGGEPVIPLGCARVINAPDGNIGNGKCIGFAEGRTTGVYDEYSMLQGEPVLSGSGYRVDGEGRNVTDIAWTFGYGKALGKATHLVISGRHFSPTLNNNIDGSSYAPLTANQIELSGITSYIVSTNWRGKYFMIDGYNMYHLVMLDNGVVRTILSRDASIEPIKLSIQETNGHVPRQLIWSEHLDRWIVICDTIWYYYDKAFNYVESRPSYFTDEDISLPVVRYIGDKTRNIFGFRKVNGKLSYFKFDLYNNTFVFDVPLDISVYGGGNIVRYYCGDEYFHIKCINTTLRSGNSGASFVYSFKINNGGYTYLGHMEMPYSNREYGGQDATLYNTIPTYNCPMKYCYITLQHYNTHCIEHAYCYNSYIQQFDVNYDKGTDYSYTPVFRATVK